MGGERGIRGAAGGVECGNFVGKQFGGQAEKGGKPLEERERGPNWVMVTDASNAVGEV